MKKKTKRTSSHKKIVIVPGMKKPVFFLLLTFILLSAIVIIFTQTDLFLDTIKVSNYKIDEIAKKDIFMRYDLEYIDETKTAVKIEAAGNQILPMYTLNKNISENILEDIKNFLSIFEELKNELVENPFLQIQENFTEVFTEEEFTSIFKINDINAFFSHVIEISNDLLSKEIVAVESQHIINNISKIEIDRGSEREEKEIKDLLQVQGIKKYVVQYCADNKIPETMKNAIITVCSNFISRANTYFDMDKTEKKINRAVSEIEPVKVTLSKGEKIIGIGDRINEKHLQHLNAIGDYSLAINITSIFGTLLYILLLFSLGFIYLFLSTKKKRMNPGRIYLLIIITSLYTILAVLFTNLIQFPIWMTISIVLPTALFCMIIAIIINTNIGFSMAVILAGIVLLVTRLNITAFLFSFMSGIGGVLSVQGAKKRIDLIKASLYLSALHLLFILTTSLIGGLEIYDYFKLLSWGIVNGFMCGILNLGLLPFVEHVLNAPTPFRLMELSDLNTPLFRRMITLAPGTYGHSISVANLAESACREIGADPLLARVGAYYHDIGKIDQSEYFIENQANGNKHDELKPNLSAAIIKSHVKIGIEKAKEIGLPKEIIEIIGEHHGNSVINYFYNQASKKDDSVKEEDYSYPGIPPKSKEAVVVMLADTVEAASRTIEKPTIAKLDKFIWTLFIKKMEDGQFDNSMISFRELKVIKDIFIHILAGQFHSRIEYPQMGKEN